LFKRAKEEGNNQNPLALKTKETPSLERGRDIKV